ncbi:MAG: efflux RND transporter periplasmic adaptor subunit [Desulfobacterales bacterium]|nr:efflux RND transporter periplasmic adaptor subunit [Desulfobacterales bacterium]
MPEILNTRKKIIIFLLLIILLLIVLGWFFLGRIDSVAYAVKREDAIKGVTVSGTVEARQDVQLSSSVNARIKELKFEEGDFVNKGQILALLDRDEALGNLIAARGQVQSAEAQLRNLLTEPRSQQVAIAQAQVNEARQNIDVLQQEAQRTQIVLQEAIAEENRLERLYQQGAVSFRDFERAGFASQQAQEAVDSARNQINAARARLQQARENLNLIQDGVKPQEIQIAQGQVQTARGNAESAVGLYDNYVITAPVSGFIVNKILSLGDIASPTSPIARLVKPESLYVNAQVEESDIPSIKLGQISYIIFDAYPDNTFKSKVVKVSKKVDPVTGTFGVEVIPPQQKGRPVIVGMTADVTFIIDKIQNALIIPRDFVSTQNGQQYVFKKVNSRARKTYVEGVTFDNNRFRVTKGLNAEDIILKGAENKKINPGNRIKVVENYRD